MLRAIINMAGMSISLYGFTEYGNDAFLLCGMINLLLLAIGPDEAKRPVEEVSFNGDETQC
jgi:hypothetical protein